MVSSGEDMQRLGKTEIRTYKGYTVFSLKLAPGAFEIEKVTLGDNWN